MHSTASSSVAADQAAIRFSITVSEVDLDTSSSEWRSLLDIAVDWIIIWAAACGACWLGGWTILPAVCVIGTRQRALGNLLHEAGHQNLSARRRINDRIAHLFLSSPLFSDLSLYRQQHARHHAWLGDPARDPDFIPLIRGNCWFHTYLRALTAPNTLVGSLFGHVFDKRLSARRRIAIFAWWGIYETLLATVLSVHFALLFASIWMIARGTVFHAITTFREMTDHYGLQPRGIFSYTRDIPNHGIASELLHPHYNGYHLTHHLFPHVPYHRLPGVHAQLKQSTVFNQHAIVCDTYFNGPRAAVRGWGAQHG